MATEITLPHKFLPRQYQLPALTALDNGKKRAVLVWHRRAGKDKLCFNYLVRKAFERVGLYFYFLPNRPQSKKVIWDNIDNSGFKMLDHIPKEIIAKINETELKIELINGSIIQMFPADIFSTSGVGSNPIGVVFSEFSVTDPAVWNFVRPILKVNGGWAIFNFTPRGQNHAYNVLKIGENNPDEWFVQVLTIEDTGILTEKDMDEERREGMPEDLIQQEYYCKFIDNASSFFKRVEENVYKEEHKPREGAPFQIGVDLAKFNDYTVITPFDLNTFKVLPQERFNQMDYVVQKAKIEAAYLRNNRGKVVLDSTGVGEPVYDDLFARGIQIEPFRFHGAKVRMDLLKNLQILLEQDKIKIPDDPILIAELKSFQYELSDRGNITAKVPDGLHDDCVMSLALAVWGIPQDPIKLNYNVSQQTGGVSPLYPEFGL